MLYRDSAIAQLRYFMNSATLLDKMLMDKILVQKIAMPYIKVEINIKSYTVLSSTFTQAVIFNHDIIYPTIL